MSDYVAEAAVKVAKGIGPGFEDDHLVYCAYSRYKLAPSGIKKLPGKVLADVRHGGCGAAFFNPNGVARNAFGVEDR